MGQLMAEQHLVWDWATKAFLAVKAGNEKRLDTAAKALSGDLIALICDKVLVPNITFKNPIELGFKYGFRKEVLGALFDYVNSISEAGDMLVKQVVGERASGESGAELIAKVTDLINMNLRLINDCMSRLRANTSEMESMGPRKAAERQRAEQERARQANAVAQEIDQRMEAAPVTGNPPDPAIVEECANYEHTIYQLEKQLEETDDSERKEELSKRIEEKEREYEYYRGSIVTPIPERFASLVSDFSAAMSNLNQRVPYELYPMPSHINDPDYFLDFDFLDVNYHSLYFSFRITPSKAQSDVSEYVQCHTARKAAWPAWCEEYIALAIDYRNRYQEILTDANAIGYGGDRYQQFRWQLEKMSENPILHQNQEQEEIDRVQTLLEYYLEAFAQHKETVARNTARREELRSNLELAIQAYEKAHDDMLKVLMGLPSFLDGCSADEAQILRVPQDSALYQTVFGDNADGSAARMRQYCREVNELYAQYQGAALRKERARAQIMPMFREFGGLGGTDVEFTDLDIMPPESYPKLHLLRAAVRDFNVQDREGKLLEYYALLANNEDYYAEKRDQFVRAAKSPALMSASVSAEPLPTYAQICSGIVSLMNNPTGFADGIKGYSPDEAGGVFDLLITPIQSAIEGRRNALSWYYSIEGGQAKVFGVEGEVSGTVVIPEAFEGSPVTELGDYLFTGSAMTAVVIPESVVKIGSCAFSACRQLGAVRIPAKVASIGEWAFAGCDTLMKFEVAADNAAYRAVNGLLFAKDGTDPIAGIGGDVTVPPGVKRIGTEVFYERALGSVTLPPGVEEVGEQAFAYSTLREITIPASVTMIEYGAFSSCDRLATVYVDRGDEDRVRELLRDSGASLSRITIVSEFTETVDGIEWSYATANGEAVVTWIAEKPEGESYGKVVVPSKLGGLPVAAIGEGAFGWHSDITEVTIPHGVRSIVTRAFAGCSMLMAVTIPASVTNIGQDAFGFNRSIKAIHVSNNGDIDAVKKMLSESGFDVNGVEFDYVEEAIPPIDANADAETVRTALEGSADPKLQVNITDGEDYNAYREWALKIGAAEVKASPFAWVSFATDSTALLAKMPTNEDLKVDEFKPSTTAGSFDFTVSVKDVTIGDKASVDNLKKLFGLEGAESLAPAAFSSENVALDFKEPQDGKLKFTATPAVDNAKSFFMKVKVK